jgi:hypothetical protein
VLDRAVPSSSINKCAFITSIGATASTSMASVAWPAWDTWVCWMRSASSSSPPRSSVSMRTCSIRAEGCCPCIGLSTSMHAIHAASLGLPCVSSTMTMSVCCAVSSPLLSPTMSVCEGNLILDGRGVRTAAPEDSRTRVCKSLSLRIAAKIASCEGADVAITSGGKGLPADVGYGDGGWNGPAWYIPGGGAVRGTLQGDMRKAVAQEQSGSACFLASQ